MTNFEEAYALGVTTSKASPPNYPLAIVAFSKAYRLDPRRKVKPGSKPDPGLFEVPTRLAAAYRLNGQLDKAQKMYEWVLSSTTTTASLGWGLQRCTRTTASTWRL
jgi:tetratricopeptide (TPR) repeat protein